MPPGLRQNALSVSTGWDRTRLSHLLDRLESRGYLRRNRITNGVEVRLLPAGQSVIDTARPSLERAVQRHMLDKLDPADRAALHRILLKLLDEHSGEAGDPPAP